MAGTAAESTEKYMEGKTQPLLSVSVTLLCASCPSWDKYPS